MDYFEVLSGAALIAAILLGTWISLWWTRQKEKAEEREARVRDLEAEVERLKAEKKIEDK